MMSTLEIELALYDYFRNGYLFLIPNVSYGFLKYEADMLTVSNSGYLSEIEIKRSRSDFLADFKKKHFHDDDRIKYKYYAISSELYNEVKDLFDKEETKKFGIFICEKRQHKYWTKEKGYYYETVYRAGLKRKPKAFCKTPLSQKDIIKLASLMCYRIFSNKLKEAKNGEK